MQKLLVCCVAALLMLCTSCKKDAPVSPPEGNGGDGGTPVSNAVRQASIDAVQQKFATLGWGNYDSAKAALVQFLHGRPEFEDAGPEDGPTVWARFTDGRLLIIANNRPADDSLTPVIPAANLSALEPGSELPTSGKARLMNALGSRYTDTTPVLKGMLEARGYVVTRVNASVTNLKNVSGDGVFYIRAHGGQGKRRDGTRTYGIWTSTPFDTLADASLKPDWDAGRLIYFMGEMDKIPTQPGTATVETHFGITKEFVGAYMGFGSKGLIYIDACGAYEGDSFRDRCAQSSDQGTGTAVGWSFVVGDFEATRAAYFVIDRLLGTNRDPITPENPPQRPFTFQLVYQNLVTRGMDTYIDPKDGSPAYFVYTPFAGSEFGLLAPSIKSFSVDEFNRKLTIDGIFGSGPESDDTVTVNGNRLTIDSWTFDRIVCSIPSSGTSAAGAVMVSVRGRRSNVVQLTEWIGEIRMIMASGWVGMNLTVTFNLHLRADVHSFRERPGVAPQAAFQISTSGASDTRGNWSLGGTNVTHYTFAGECSIDASETWANNSGSLPIVTGSGVDGVIVLSDIRPRTKTMKLTLNAQATNTINWNGVDSIRCSGSPPVGVPYSGVASFSTSHFDENAAGFDTLTISLAPNFDIMPIAVQRPNIMNPYHGGNPYVTQPEGRTTIECAGIQARYPPDPNAAQRPHLVATHHR